MFELTMHFKHEMIGIWQRFQRNFELTVFKLTMPDQYRHFVLFRAFRFTFNPPYIVVHGRYQPFKTLLFCHFGTGNQLNIYINSS